jgi:dolichyl-phosphate beta-glucosyltransferase
VAALKRRLVSEVSTPLDRKEVEPVLSIVIPAYNEERRIVPSLERIREYLVAWGEPSEVIVVDDGSRDGTSKVVESEVPRYQESGIPLRLLGDGTNRGKGATVRTGVLAASGYIVLFTDADLSAPIDEAPKLVEPILRGEAAVALGSRGLDYKLIGVHQPPARELAGRFFNVVMRLVTGLPFKDTQCGFKAFRRDAARDIFSRVRIDRFGFDVEALYLARKLGYETLEVGVVWNNVEGTTVSMVGGIAAFADPLRVRLNDLRGLYSDRSVARRSAPVAK